MGWIFTLKRSRRSLDRLNSFNKLKSVLCFNWKLSLVSEEISIVCKDTVICSSWNRNAESTIHIISKLKLKAETHRLIEFPRKINSYLLLCDTNIEPLRKGNFDSNISNIINELAFKIAILISIIENSKAGCCFNIKWHHWHHYFSFVEVEHR